MFSSSLVLEKSNLRAMIYWLCFLADALLLENSYRLIVNYELFLFIIKTFLFFHMIALMDIVFIKNLFIYKKEQFKDFHHL